MKNDGGPAFPVSHEWQDEKYAVRFPSGGMTLRDYFAAAALPGVQSLVMGAMRNPKASDEILEPQLHARLAYEMADAMLAERDK